MSAPVVPGADAFTLDGGPRGVLLLHGFTGNPFALRPFGEHLQAGGYTVIAPRYPGHGTTWEELEGTHWEDWVGEASRALAELRERCEQIALVGLSMGGAMATHLAVQHGEKVKALVMVNPYVLDRRIAFAPLIRFLRRSVKGIGDDIKKAGQTEKPYTTVPLRGLVQLNRFTGIVRKELPQLRVPLLVFHAPEDHTVPKGNAQLVMDRAGSASKRLVLLRDSYHVAWVDNDADAIFQQTDAFLAEHLGARAG